MKLNMDSGIMRALAKITDIMLLQLMFILTSLPVFTVGAGLAALFSVTRKLKHDSITSTIRSYFAEFKANFKQGTIAWLLFLAAAAVLTFDILYYTGQERTGLNAVMLIAAYVLAIVLYFIMMYAFPLMAWFENPVRLHLKNALLMSIGHFLTTVLVTVVYGLFVLLGIFVLPLFFFVGFSGAIYVSGKLISRALAKHSKELEPEIDENDARGD